MASLLPDFLWSNISQCLLTNARLKNINIENDRIQNVRAVEIAKAPAIIRIVYKEASMITSKTSSFFKAREYDRVNI